MTDLLNLLGFFLAVAVFVGCMDRLRQINWRTARAPHVAFYLCFAVWALWSVSDGTEPAELLGMAGVLVMLWSSRERWRNGPPGNVTKPGELGPPEIVKDSVWR